MAIMVRKGNPKGIKDWDDLAKPGVGVVIPNPKTAGNGRYSYLAMWAFAKEKFGGDEAKIKELLSGIFKNVPVLDTGGRGATTTFVQRGIGDALLTFEAEILTTIREAGVGQVRNCLSFAECRGGNADRDYRAGGGAPWDQAVGDGLFELPLRGARAGTDREAFLSSAAGKRGEQARG